MKDEPGSGWLGLDDWERCVTSADSDVVGQWSASWDSHGWNRLNIRRCVANRDSQSGGAHASSDHNSRGGSRRIINIGDG